MEENGRKTGKSWLLGFAVIAIIWTVLAIIAYPLFTRTHHPPGRDACYSNLKEIALALSMYIADNAGVLPSSAASGSSERVFRTTIGTLPPPSRPARLTTYAETLYSDMKERNSLFCPRDPNNPWRENETHASPPPGTKTSYVLKKAIDQAWLDPKVKARREKDYKYPAEQITFYERKQFHWGGGKIAPDLGPGYVTLNAAFIDGHVKTIRIRDPEITRCREPDYYNWDVEKRAPAKRPEIDPRKYCDYLQ